MSSDNEPVVGFIGLGIMGAAMTSNLQKAGYRVVVHDARREAVSMHIAPAPAGPNRRRCSPLNAT
jgi:3-hydroxyisobutyrate dehydrogenase